MNILGWLTITFSNLKTLSIQRLNYIKHDIIGSATLEMMMNFPRYC